MRSSHNYKMYRADVRFWECYVARRTILSLFYVGRCALLSLFYVARRTILSLFYVGRCALLSLFYVARCTIFNLFYMLPDVHFSGYQVYTWTHE